jgi:hypothetical protein
MIRGFENFLLWKIQSLHSFTLIRLFILVAFSIENDSQDPIRLDSFVKSRAELQRVEETRAKRLWLGTEWKIAVKSEAAVPKCGVTWVMSNDETIKQSLFHVQAICKCKYLLIFSTWRNVLFASAPALPLLGEEGKSRFECMTGGKTLLHAERPSIKGICSSTKLSSFPCPE